MKFNDNNSLIQQSVYTEQNDNMSGNGSPANLHDKKGYIPSKFVKKIES